MRRLGGRSVFFVRDTPLAIDFYTSRLGFALDWTHAVQGRAFVAQVSWLGLQIILNQVETNTAHRCGHSRLFVGLDETQTAAVLDHVRSKGIMLAYTHWGAPTAVLVDRDDNEIFLWFSDAERARWQVTHEAKP